MTANTFSILRAIIKAENAEVRKEKFINLCKEELDKSDLLNRKHKDKLLSETIPGKYDSSINEETLSKNIHLMTYKVIDLFVWFKELINAGECRNLSMISMQHDTRIDDWLREDE